MRKWLVRNFELETWFKVYDQPVKVLRASRILWPMFVFGALIIMGTNPLDYGFEWYHTFIYIIWIAGIYFGFNFYNLGYMGRYPYTYDELDEEQKHSYLSGVNAGQLPNPEPNTPFGTLLPWQKVELERLDEVMEEKYKGNWAGWPNMLPLLISIVGVIIYALFIVQI